MHNTVLTQIIYDKISWIKTRKKQQPLISFQYSLKLSDRNFYNALKNTHKVFILECKKASPSKGLIRKNFNPLKIAKIYRQYASAISVLTDEKYFQGNFNFIPIIREVAEQPILCKDFFIDEYQIYLARYYKADAILLMLSILNDAQYLQLSKTANSLNMGILTEVQNKKELKRAIALKAKTIGINNRNLHDSSINLNKIPELSSLLPTDDTVIISESGIQNYRDLCKLKPLVNGFLIGTSLMNKDDLDTATRKLILGHNKVCGLKNPEDAKVSYKAGAIYGGLNFVKKSVRRIHLKQAKNILTLVPLLKYVSIYCNEEIKKVIEDTKKLEMLEAIQLHGTENSDYITKLRKQLPPNIQIWKALSVNKKLPKRNYSQINRYLFDNGTGGTGKSFKWSLLKNQNLNNILLAGGLNSHNCVEAIKLGCSGLDFNSGVENTPGVKDHNKIMNIFNILRNY